MLATFPGFSNMNLPPIHSEILGFIFQWPGGHIFPVLQIPKRADFQIGGRLPFSEGGFAPLSYLAPN